MRAWFSLPRASRVRIGVYDVMGRQMAVLEDRDFEAGRHQVAWNASTSRGLAPAGLYFMRMQVGGMSFSQRVVVIR